MSDKRKTLLIVSQVYVPDPAAVGQYLADAAEEMAMRGWRVVVFAPDRGYDDTSRRFPASETRNGVFIRRLPASSMGKKTILHRVVGQLSFCFQALIRILFAGGIDRIFITTAPPIGGIVALMARLFRRVSVKYWVMDINPDQAIALGKVRPHGLLVRVLNFINDRLLKAASDVVVLDKFMEETMRRKAPVTRARFQVIAPWPLEEYLQSIPHDQNPFRAEHDLEGRFVIMYSGNHSPAHPLETLLMAARRLKDEARLVFVFVGGGQGKAGIEKFVAENGLANTRLLPYQPLEQLKYSLSAADLHVVSMGDKMIGVVHPCKVYGVMSVGRPIVVFGPRSSPSADLVSEGKCGWQIEHGDIDGAVDLFRRLLNSPESDLRERGGNGKDLVRERFGRAQQCGRLCEVLERD